MRMRQFYSSLSPSRERQQPFPPSAELSDTVTIDGNPALSGLPFSWLTVLVALAGVAFLVYMRKG